MIKRKVANLLFVIFLLFFYPIFVFALSEAVTGYSFSENIVNFETSVKDFVSGYRNSIATIGYTQSTLAPYIYKDDSDVLGFEKDVINDFDDLPDYITDSFIGMGWKIIITGDQKYFTAKANSENVVYASSDYDKKIIYMNTKYPQSLGYKTVIHEIFHFIDHVVGTPSDDVATKYAIEEEGTIFSSYPTTSTALNSGAEYLAEAFRLSYYLPNNEIKGECPLTYNVINSVLREFDDKYGVFYQTESYI